MVAKNDEGKPVQVPELELCTHEEMRHFVTAIRRSKMRKESQAKLKQDYDAFIPKEDFTLLENQRCSLTFSKSDMWAQKNKAGVITGFKRLLKS